MDRWKFVNEKWIPRTVSRGEGYVLGIAASPSNLRPFGAPPSKGRRENAGFPYSKSFSRIVIPKSPSVLWYNMTRRMTRS